MRATSLHAAPIPPASDNPVQPESVPSCRDSSTGVSPVGPTACCPLFFNTTPPGERRQQPAEALLIFCGRRVASTDLFASAPGAVTPPQRRACRIFLLNASLLPEGDASARPERAEACLSVALCPSCRL